MQVQGGLRPDSGMIVTPRFTDTATANLSVVSLYGGMLIRVLDTLWMRNEAATTWVKQRGDGSGGGGGAGTVTDFIFTDGNGFDGTVTNSTSTPTLSLTTTVSNTQVMVSSSGAISGTANLTFDQTRMVLYDNSSRNNLLIGSGTGSTLTSSTDNIGLGVSALRFTEGDYNIGIGRTTLYNTVGDNNVAIGLQSLYLTDSSNSTAVGYNSGLANYGKENVAIGSGSGNYVVTDSSVYTTSEIVTSSTTISGANTAAFISANSLSVGVEYPFALRFNGGIPTPYSTDNPYLQGTVTDASTIQFANVSNFTSQGSGTMAVILYNKQDNAIAIGFNVRTDSTNQISIGNSDNTLFKSNAAAFDIVTTSETGDMWMYQTDRYTPVSPQLVSDTLNPYITNLLNGCISGCVVTWDVDYTYIISPSTYRINGIYYSSPADTITLSAADPTNDRIDVFVVNTSGANAVVEGTAANPALFPDVDDASQLQISFAVVAANTTEPNTVVTDDIYKENAGQPTEWDYSDNTANLNPASTNNPYAGTVDIEATNLGVTQQFTMTVSTSPDFSDYTQLNFKIRSKAAWANNRILSIQFFASGLPVGNAVTLGNSSYGFASGSISAYQNISIP